MRIHQNRRLAMRVQPIGVEQGMSLGRDDLDILHANAAQLFGHKFCRLLHVALMFLERADTGDAKKTLQLVKKTRLIIASKINCWGSHNGLPFWRVGRGYLVKKIAGNVSVYLNPRSR